MFDDEVCGNGGGPREVNIMEIAEFDADGYLISGPWSRHLAQQIATNMNIQLTSEHWQVIDCVRTYFEKSSRTPSMRPLVKLVKNQVGKHLGSSIALAHLFPPPTSGSVAKISGLPKPSDCL